MPRLEAGRGWRRTFMGVTPLNTLQAPFVTPVPAVISAQEQASHRQLIQAVRAVNPAELYGQDNAVTFVLDQTGQALLQVRTARPRRSSGRSSPRMSLVQRCAQCSAVSGLKRMTRRDGWLACYTQVAIVGPWHTEPAQPANRGDRRLPGSVAYHQNARWGPHGAGITGRA